MFLTSKTERLKAKITMTEMNPLGLTALCFSAEVEVRACERHPAVSPSPQGLGAVRSPDKLWPAALPVVTETRSSVLVCYSVNSLNHFPTSSELLAWFQTTNRKQLCVFVLGRKRPESSHSCGEGFNRVIVLPVRSSFLTKNWPDGAASCSSSAAAEPLRRARLCHKAEHVALSELYCIVPSFEDDAYVCSCWVTDTL